MASSAGKPDSTGHISPGNQSALQGPKPGEGTDRQLSQNSLGLLNSAHDNCLVCLPALAQCLLELVLGEGWGSGSHLPPGLSGCGLPLTKDQL